MVEALTISVLIEILILCLQLEGRGKDDSRRSGRKESKEEMEETRGRKGEICTMIGRTSSKKEYGVMRQC